MSNLFERYVDDHLDGITDEDREAIEDEAQTRFEDRADEYRKGE
jgi:hypothetical protein